MNSFISKTVNIRNIGTEHTIRVFFGVHMKMSLLISISLKHKFLEQSSVINLVENIYGVILAMEKK